MKKNILTEIDAWRCEMNHSGAWCVRRTRVSVV